MAYAGKSASVRIPGAATAFTAEATTKLVANTVYQITNASRRVLDRTAAITVKKDGVAQAATLYTLNRLTGTVTFLADIGGAAVVTMDGSYLPMSAAAEARSFNLSTRKNHGEDSAFGDTYVTRVATLLDCDGSLGAWQSVDVFFRDALIFGAPVVLEFSRDGTNVDVRAWGLLGAEQIAAAVDGLVEKTVPFSGAADSDGRSFAWLV
jgi:hypothetical protein